MVRLLKQARSYIFSVDDTFSLGRASFIIGICTLATKLVSLLRVNLFASRFAAGDLADVYFSAFRIPDFLFNLLILGTLSVAFIPVYVQIKAKDKTQSTEFARTVLHAAVIFMAVLLVISFFALEKLTSWLLPGFSPEKVAMTVTFSKILFLSPLLFTISNVFSSILTAHKRFLIVSLAPILYNVGIIIGILVFYPLFGFYGIAWGVVLGAFLHMLLQVPELYRVGFTWRPQIKLKTRAFRDMVRLFVPRILAFDSNNISLIIGSIFGSSVATGGVAVFSYAFDLQSVPLGIFALSTAAAAFPVLSDAYVAKDTREYLRVFLNSFIRILFFILPISLSFLIFRAQIVRILLGHGQFGWEATITTFNALGVFSASLCAQALTPLLARAFYSLHNTVVPVVVGIISMCINAVVALYTYHTLGIIGVVIGFSASSIFNCLTLLLLLRFGWFTKPEFDDRADHFDSALVKAVLKIVVASLTYGAVSYGILYAAAAFLKTNTTLGLMVQVFLAALSGGIVYLYMTYWFDIKETKHVIDRLRKIFRIV